jgi:hypothetical protein
LQTWPRVTAGCVGSERLGQTDVAAPQGRARSGIVIHPEPEVDTRAGGSTTW